MAVLKSSDLLWKRPSIGKRRRASTAAKASDGGMAAGSNGVRRALRRADLAYVALASSEIARDINRDVVLELVRSNQPIARVDLARLSGLQRSTVSASLKS